MRLILVLAFYSLAAAALLSAFNLAPDMTWPATATEYTAAALLIVGSIAKLAGHFTLSSMGRE